MRLVVVGNAHKPWDGEYNRQKNWRPIANFINSSDLVVRFKRMENQYKWWTGRKTDILYTRSNGATAGKDLRRRPMYFGVQKPKKVFTNFDDYPYERPNGDHDPKIPIDFTDAMTKHNKWDPKSVEKLDQSVAEKTRNILYEASQKYVAASVGFLAFVHLLHDERFADYEKYYVGFTFEGWNGHHWNTEKQLVEKWTAEGKLTPLSSVLQK